MMDIGMEDYEAIAALKYNDLGDDAYCRAKAIVVSSGELTLFVSGIHARIAIENMMIGEL